MTAEKRMKLANIIAKLPEEEADSLYGTACRLYESHTNDEKPGCPYCHSKAVVRNGHKCGKQEYRCKDCGKTFVSTTNTLMANSHQTREVFEATMGCIVKDVTKETGSGFYNLNTVNSFHSFIKRQYEFYRGGATKYLNRYNVLFSAAYKCTAERLQQSVSSLLTVSGIRRTPSCRDIKTAGLLLI